MMGAEIDPPNRVLQSCGRLRSESRLCTYFGTRSKGVQV